MIKHVIDVVCICFMQIMKILSIYKSDGERIDLKGKKLYISILIFLIFTYLSFEISAMYIRPFFILSSLYLICLLVLNKSIKRAIILVIFSALISIVSEIACTICIGLFSILSEGMSLEEIAILFDDNYKISMFMNISCGILQYFISSSKITKVLLNNICSLSSNQTYKKIVRIFLIFAVIAIPGYAICYFVNHAISNILIFLGLLIILIYLFINDFEARQNFEKTKQKYDSTLSDLIEYEEMIDKYRINNHENKNQLQIIRNMIKQKDKDVEKYIDNLVDTVYKSNEKLLLDVSILPSGGIRASIYTKLISMDNNEIKCILSIDRKIRNIDYFDENTELCLKVCNILNIFIDNAIDEVKGKNKKDRIINIEAYYLEDENNIIFEISNKIFTIFDINKIEEAKYTTKSDGHGYGLTLARDIISSEKRLENITRINDDVFIQKLIINIKSDKK